MQYFVQKKIAQAAGLQSPVCDTFGTSLFTASSNLDNFGKFFNGWFKSILYGKI